MSKQLHDDQHGLQTPGPALLPIALLPGPRGVALGLCLAGIALLVSGEVQAQTLGAYREIWSNLNFPQNDLTYLTNTTYNPSWPNKPDPIYTTILPGLEAETNTGRNNYGQRVRAYLVPPTTGSYTFWIASDDQSNLWLSTDDQPSHAKLIANVAAWTNSREWTKEANQKSVPIALVGGVRYYIEVLMQQGGGGDNLAVQWQLPSGVLETPIPASRLQLDQMPVISGQPSNTTVIEMTPASFTVRVSNFAPPTFQWQQGTNNIAGATNATLVLPNVPLSQNGSFYRCILTNIVGSVTSSYAMLTVLRDTTPPVLGTVVNFGATNIVVNYSKAVDPATGANVSHYAVSGSIGVQTAVLAGAQTVVLTVSPLTLGNTYTVTVNGVLDRAATPNLIAANSQVSFVAKDFVPYDIGAPTPAGSSALVPGGLDVYGGGGTGIGGTTDQFQFDYRMVTGDFDLQVQVQGLSGSDVWAKAGLMARESLDVGARFAAACATPSMAGCFFEYRSTTNQPSVLSGMFRPNLPNQWLRLQRQGDTFNGYASYDGSNWVQLGSASLPMAVIYLGYAVTSHDPSNLSRVQFRGFGLVLAGTVGLFNPPGEPLQACSRRTGVVISEIMYKPAPRADTNNTEYIELYNSNPYFEDISGWQIVGDISYTFPTNTLLQGGAFLVVAASPSGFQRVYDVANVIGPYGGSLKKSGSIGLNDVDGTILLEIAYSDQAPWPMGAGGTGHSIVLARPSYGEGDGQAWDISDVVGGSPGGPEIYHPSPLRNVLINEFLANSGTNYLDYIELYNHSAAAVDLSGCVLTDATSTHVFIIPAGTVLSGGGFVAFDENQMGFALSASGGSIWFENPDGSRVLDAINYEAQDFGVSFGRWPDGGAEFYPLAARTPGGPNGSILVRDIVINELMFKPLSGNDDDQYVELYNKGTNVMNLGGWQFTAGITYAIPPNTLLAPGGYLVVARNYTNLFARYPHLNAANTVGNYPGKLSHKGGRLALAMPVPHVTTNSTGLVTNTLLVVEDEVSYRVGGRWGQWSDGGGSSLELVNPDTNHRLAYNWADSDETSKSVWTNLQFTGILDNGQSYNSLIDLVQIGLLDVGECLMDNIEVLAGGTNGPNYVSNPTFESGLGNWECQGDHNRSTLETNGGYASAQCLHVRSSDGLWTGYNSVQGVLNNSTLAAGGTVTLRLKARWLRGWPEVIMRLRGDYLELSGALPVPLNLGTPGLPNSMAVTHAAPAICEVNHWPPMPAANQPVLVTARFHDVNGFTPQVLYRLDTVSNSAPTYLSMPMVDDGTGGDQVAGDGLYTATIPGAATGTVVAFLVQAQDSFGAMSVFPKDQKDGTGMPRECVFMFGDTISLGSFGQYHIYMTQNWVNRWAALGGLSNESHDGTFVDGGGRVIYNMVGRAAGSPYHQYTGSPVTASGGQHWTMPGDDLMLGTTSFNKQHMPGNGPLDDNTLQREQTSFWMARQLHVPWDYRRYYVLYFNGSRHGPLMEDSQVPGTDLIKQHWPNDNNGFLHKNNGWFEFDNTLTSTGYDNFVMPTWCVLGRITTTVNGVTNLYKLGRYRWMYWIRNYPDSASNYTNVFAMIDAMNTPTNTPLFYTNVEAMVDTEEWMRMSALEHATGDWDSFFTQNQWNMYVYKPLAGKWTALKWDWNITLGGGTATWGPDAGNLFNVGANDSVMGTFQNYPPYRRAYLRALKEIAAVAMNNTYADPVLDAKYKAFLASGIAPYFPGGGLTDPGIAGGLKIWIGTMRQSILTTLTNQGVANVRFGLVGTNYLSTGTNLVLFTGTAPVETKEVMVNGAIYPVIWTSTTNWTLRVALQSSTNVLSFQGLDVYGKALTNSSLTVTSVYTKAIPPTQGGVVINEIMYNPLLAGAEYVELFNTSSNFAFDLSGWRLNGTGYTFPASSSIAPRGFLVLAADRTAYASAYGTNAPPFDTFPGTLQTNGETLTLYQPGLPPGPDLVVDKVRYEPVLPWPIGSNGITTAASIQVIDPTQPRSRPCNWATSYTPVFTIPASTNAGWRFVSVTGTNSNVSGPIRLYLYLATVGDVYLDDVALVNGFTAAVGINYVRNGGFESSPLLEVPPLTNSWIVPTNYTNTTISTAVHHGGAASLHVVCGTAIPTAGKIIEQDLSPAPTNKETCTLSFWYLVTTNASNLVARVVNSTITVTTNVGPVVTPVTLVPAIVSYSPGATNTFATTLPAIPPLWLNEIQPLNQTGPTNSAGQHTPWLELYNAGTNTVSLNGLFLSDNYTNLGEWAFPAGASLSPGEFKVIFADGQTSLSTLAELHTSFALNSPAGALALSRQRGSILEVLDYINYANVHPNWSYGSYPDGQPFDRQQFYHLTPGGTNNGATAPLTVSINEWMAGNTHTLTNPATGKADDWFELFNYGALPADLGGYNLTDTFTNKFKFPIPAGYQIPPLGCLLVWADKQTSANTSNSADLHASFKLSKSGTSIGLFGADGTSMDQVTFGAQTSDISQGRCPDGGANIIFQPTPSPRLPNICATNTPPALAPIADRLAYLGDTVTFQALASDPDSPPEILAYTLAPGAPVSATIDLGTGIFRWLVAGVPALSTNPITVRVTDNGTPPLSATQTFSVIILPQPIIAAPSLNGSTLTLAWPSVPGRTYRLLFKIDMGDPVWHPYLDFPATGTTTSTSLDTTALPRLFLRLTVLP